MRGWIISAPIAFAAALSSAFAQSGDASAIAPTASEAPVDPAATDETASELAASVEETDATGIHDPLEGFNRAMFKTNNAIDAVLLVPAAKTYRFVTNEPMRQGLRNFLSNAQMPTNLLNDLLQAEFERAGETTARFLINSTLGIGGLIDVAAKWGIAPHSEDFGQTLAVWGIGSGPYLYLPLFGPSSVRDGTGRIVDIATDPLFWISTDPAQYARYARFGATAVSFREPYLEQVEDIKEKSLDPYASFRSYYTQSRKRQIANGREDYEDLPEMGDELDEIE